VGLEPTRLEVLDPGKYTTTHRRPAVTPMAMEPG